MDKLTTSGPYAFVRNPLYIGSSLLVLGAIIMGKLSYAGMTFFLAWILVYMQTIREEEKILEEEFKEEYVNYKKRVHRFLPTFFPYREGEEWSFSFARLVDSKEYKLFSWTCIVVIIFYIKKEFVQDISFTLKHWALMAIACLLGTADLIGEIIKRKKAQRGRTANAGQR